MEVPVYSRLLIRVKGGFLAWLDASALWERLAFGFCLGWLFGALVLGPIAELRRVWWLLHR